MRFPLSSLLALPLAAACSSSTSSPPPLAPAASNIKHVVVVIQENHSFDAYFGNYCTAPAGSSPTCTQGPACCEAAPAKDPSGAPPTALDDNENGSFDPNHEQACELDEIDGGKMDHYVKSTVPQCGDAQNFAVASPQTMATYFTLAGKGALADRYFQSIAGQSSSNDMYFARARFVFTDNTVTPTGLGSTCGLAGLPGDFTDTTLAGLLAAGGVSWAFYAEGYQAMADAQKTKKCPAAPADCAAAVTAYPCDYAPEDNPFQFFKAWRDDPATSLDFARFAKDIAGGTLPSVSFVKALGYKSEHPGFGTTVSAGEQFVSDLASEIAGSAYAADTLLLVAYDESGGYFDHVPPPPTSAVDGKPYGARVPLIAVGAFAKPNFVSHVTMEHASIVKFIEWNWLGGKTLGGREPGVANIGSLLDPAKTGVAVPEQ